MLAVRRKRSFEPSIPKGLRVYAIGDIHGRADLLDRLLQKIEKDVAAREPADVRVILLGDLIDRGPESATVVHRAMKPPLWANFLSLKGNHEAALLRGLNGNKRMLSIWLDNGGDRAARSFGLTSAMLNASNDEIVASLKVAIDPEILEWVARCPVQVQFGDYLFVHAGIRPGVSLNEQSEADLLWIRGGFLDSSAFHGVMVVHGHSVSERIQHLHNRIGLDTGAYATGRLSAMGFEAKETWVLAT